MSDRDANILCEGMCLGGGIAYICSAFFMPTLNLRLYFGCAGLSMLILQQLFARNRKQKYSN